MDSMKLVFEAIQNAVISEPDHIIKSNITENSETCTTLTKCGAMYVLANYMRVNNKNHIKDLFIIPHKFHKQFEGKPFEAIIDEFYKKITPDGKGFKQFTALQMNFGPEERLIDGKIVTKDEPPTRTHAITPFPKIIDAKYLNFLKEYH